MAKGWQIAVGGAIATLAALGLYSWISPNAFNPNRPPEVATPDVEPGLTLRNVTLEQPDENGVLLWRVKGETVTYSPNQQVAQVTRPDSELFQDGEVIYNVIADTGEIRDNGNVIFLRGNIVATGVKNGSILRGNELEWRPEEDVLIMRQEITGSHPQLRAVADEAYVYNREDRMELKGNVVANTVVEDPQTEPWLKLQAQELVWFWADERIDSPQPLRIEQFKDKTVTDVVVGQRGSVDLADQVAVLQGSVAMQMLELPLHVASEAMEWRVAEQVVNVNQPLTVVHPTEKLTVTGRQGRMQLAEQVVTVSQDVVAVGERNQSRLTTDSLSWNVQDQILMAEGRVNYLQANPGINLKGNRGVGRLNEQTFVVDGGQVVTEIVPN
jgi:LPS export ABC transporter protein LptC